jgi:hypothetical protein
VHENFHDRDHLPAGIGRGARQTLAVLLMAVFDGTDDAVMVAMGLRANQPLEPLRMAVQTT